MPTARVGDISLHYEAHGEGEPLLLIMGYGADSNWWYMQTDAFSREYRVIVFDNRGTGLSDKPDVPYTMPMMADDAAGLLDALDIGTAHVYGVSMGGMIAQELVLHHPERVTSLILGCTMPGGHNAVPPEPESLLFLLDFERTRSLPLEQQAEELLPYLFSQGFLDRNRDRVGEFVSRAFEHPTPVHGYRRQSEAFMSFNVYDRLPEINAPTLVMAGTADRLVPVENARILASRIPNAELVIFENVGHGFNGEVAEESNKAVLDFLRRHSGRNAPGTAR
jgi:pimeloyl-ACP methyl ester carboxylesterase